MVSKSCDVRLSGCHPQNPGSESSSMWALGIGVLDAASWVHVDFWDLALGAVGMALGPETPWRLLPVQSLTRTRNRAKAVPKACFVQQNGLELALWPSEGFGMWSVSLLREDSTLSWQMLTGCCGLRSQG